jgi:hypothetical protein
MNIVDTNKSSTCHEHIEYIYRSPQINKLISKVHPLSLQDDLRQELAMALLTMDCSKIVEIYEANALLPYCLNISCEEFQNLKIVEHTINAKKRNQKFCQMAVKITSNGQSLLQEL